jgi:hypothetical protein
MPAILIAEATGYPDDYFHLPQFFACIICVFSGIKYLRQSKGKNLIEAAGQEQANTVTSEKKENPIIAGPFAKSLVTMAVCLAGAWIVVVILILIYISTCEPWPDF